MKGTSGHCKLKLNFSLRRFLNVLCTFNLSPVSTETVDLLSRPGFFIVNFEAVNYLYKKSPS